MATATTTMDKIVLEHAKFGMNPPKEINKIPSIDFIRELKIKSFPSDACGVIIKEGTHIIPIHKDEYSFIAPEPTTSLTRDVEVLPAKVFTPINDVYSNIVFVIYKEYPSQILGWKYGFFVDSRKITIIKDINP